jgi:2-dehydropantoate 2-reductase
VRLPWLIIGDGAVGRVWAWRLARAGEDVWLLGRKSAAGRGELELSGVDVGKVHVHRVTLSEVHPLPEAAGVVIAVKTYQLEIVLGELRGKLSPGVPCILPQNGIGICALADRVLPGRRWIRAVSWFGAVARGSAGIELKGHGPVDLVADEDVDVRPLGAALERGGLEVRYPENLAEAEWRKGLMNSALNALCALEGVRNGEALDDPDLRAVFHRLLHEALDVATALGLPWNPIHERKIVEEAVRQVAQNENSTLQDLRAGRPTEIPWINGAVARIGQEIGVPARTHELMAHLIAHREKSAVAIPTKH